VQTKIEAEVQQSPTNLRSVSKTRIAIIDGPTYGGLPAILARDSQNGFTDDIFRFL
jgi:hypothetical protein